MKILERLFSAKKPEEKKAPPGRNDLCWCGSGRKYKHCHLDRDAQKRRLNGGRR